MITAEEALKLTQDNIEKYLGSALDEIDRSIRGAAKRGRSSTFYHTDEPIFASMVAEAVTERGFIAEASEDGSVLIAWGLED